MMRPAPTIPSGTGGLRMGNVRLRRLLKGLLCAAMLAGPAWATAQGGLFIGAGGQVVASGTPSIVITDGRWQNNGTFTAGNSLVRIEGTATNANSAIEGSSVTTFYDFTQQKTANGIQLNVNTNVTNNFTMNGGLFQLNGFDVTLGTATGQIVNETELNRITGTTGGRIIKTTTLTAPVAVNPGNLGASITSAANLGVTTIRRGHVQQTDGANGISIFRYYDILPTNNAGLNATLRQQYFDAELGTLVEADLVHFNSINNLDWYVRGFTARSTATNFVDNGPYPNFANRWTLASPINRPLPVTFLDEGVNCDEDKAEVYWYVDESEASDYFQVEASDDQASWGPATNGWVRSQGTGRHRYRYEVVDAAKFFRVLQVDVDGATQVSDAHRMTCNFEADWSVWPVPSTGQIQVQAPLDRAIEQVEVTDMLGQVVYRQQMDGLGVTNVSIDLQGRVAAAIYMLKIYPSEGLPIVKKIEIKY